MFEVLCFSVALIGSGLAGAYDLKTTEIPDWVSLGMIVLGLAINAARSVAEWSPMFFLYSASAGSAFFAMGLLMYLSGQWGGGDAKVLAGVGTLIPIMPSFSAAEAVLPFPVSFLVNLFMIGAAYIIIYSIVYAARKREILEDFVENMKGSRRNLLLLLLASLGIIVLLTVVMGISPYRSNFVVVLPGVLALFMLWKFLRSVESSGFVTEVDPTDLQPGDMLADPAEEIDESSDEDGEMKEISLVLLSLATVPVSMYFLGFKGFYFYISFLSPLSGIFIFLLFLVSRLGLGISEVFKTSSTRIRGVTEKEVEKLKKREEKIRIRDGVRFTPVFSLSLLATVYLGNLLLFIVYPT